MSFIITQIAVGLTLLIFYLSYRIAKDTFPVKCKYCGCRYRGEYIRKHEMVCGA